MIRKLTFFLAASLCITTCRAESATVVPLPIIHALAAGEKFFGGAEQWLAVNDEQRYFLEHFNVHRKSFSLFDNKELQAWVSPFSSELNAIAQQHKFDIRFEPFEKNEFGILSILDVALRWQEKGTEATIVHKSRHDPAIPAVNVQAYNAVKLERGVSVAQEHQTNYAHPIVKIATTERDTVYMTIADQPLEGFALVEKIKKLQKSMRRTAFDEAVVVFPVVHLNKQEDITWLQGMSQFVYGDQFIINQAKQQTKLTLDETGAQVQSAVMISIVCTSCGIDESILINKPFYLWIERAGSPIPILYGYIDIADWEKVEHTPMLMWDGD